MLRFALVIVVASCILDVHSYVIQDNNAAKETSDQETEYNKNIDEENNRISRRKRTSYDESSKKKMAHSNSKSESLESVVLALNTGIKRILEQNNKHDFLDKYAKQIVNLFSHLGHGEHGHKSNVAEHKYGIKPEVVRFNAEKPSKKFELNPKVLSNLLNKFLKSDTFKHNFDNIVRQASLVYRAVQEADKKKV